MGNVEICKDGAPISRGLDCLIILKRIIGALIYLVAILEYVAIKLYYHIWKSLSLSLSNGIFLILFSSYFLVMIMNIEYVIYKSTSNE